MTSSLVGSEMCIRDRTNSMPLFTLSSPVFNYNRVLSTSAIVVLMSNNSSCLLYTSDAADDM
eukprot:190339-Prorocentrum_lima.AAC.1